MSRLGINLLARFADWFCGLTRRPARDQKLKMLEVETLHDLGLIEARRRFAASDRMFHPPPLPLSGGGGGMIDLKKGKIAIWFGDLLAIVDIAEDCLRVNAAFPDSGRYRADEVAISIKKTMRQYLRLPEDE